MFPLFILSSFLYLPTICKARVLHTLSYLLVFPPDFSFWNVAWLKICSIASHMYAVRAGLAWGSEWFWCGGGAVEKCYNVGHWESGQLDSQGENHAMLVRRPGTWCTSDMGWPRQIINKWGTKRESDFRPALTSQLPWPQCWAIYSRKSPKKCFLEFFFLCIRWKHHFNQTAIMANNL